MSDPYCEPACPKCREDQHEMHGELARLRDQLAEKDQKLDELVNQLKLATAPVEVGGGREAYWKGRAETAERELAHEQQLRSSYQQKYNTWVVPEIEAAERRAAELREALRAMKPFVSPEDFDVDGLLIATDVTDADAPESGAGRDGVITVGELKRAKRRALNILDAWLDVTGAIGYGCSWHYELESIVEDAVEIGCQHALGDFRKLDAEHDAPTPDPAAAGEREDVPAHSCAVCGCHERDAVTVPPRRKG